jgi:hypothetical protein
MLRALRHDLAIDVVVSVVVLMIHFGTFAGVMTAAIAGLFTSIAKSGAKRLFGYRPGQPVLPLPLPARHLTFRSQHTTPSPARCAAWGFFIWRF